MKKTAVLILCGLLCLSLTMCGENSEQNATVNDQTTADTITQNGTDDTTSQTIEQEPYISEISYDREVISSAEYDGYYDLFFEKNTEKYVDTAVTKEGRITTIHDSFSGKQRYYIYGYGDDAMTQDWQWELDVADPASLPAAGSYVKVSGTLSQSSDALDGYWITDPVIEVTESYEASAFDIDTFTMGNTLIRVQLTSVVNYASEYSSKTIRILGKIGEHGIITNNSDTKVWSLVLDYDGELPQEGTVVLVEGVFEGSSAHNCKILAQKITK